MSTTKPARHELMDLHAYVVSYRGPLAIHAGARFSHRGIGSPLVNEALQRVAPADQHGDRSPWLCGVIIGVIDLVDVHHSVSCAEGEHGEMCSVWAESSYDEHGGRIRRGIVHLVLEHPRPLEVPIPCRGALGLWTPPAEVLEQLEVLR